MAMIWSRYQARRCHTALMLSTLANKASRTLTMAGWVGSRHGLSSRSYIHSIIRKSPGNPWGLRKARAKYRLRSNHGFTTWRTSAWSWGRQSGRGLKVHGTDHVPAGQERTHVLQQLAAAVQLCAAGWQVCHFTRSGLRR